MKIERKCIECERDMIAVSGKNQFCSSNCAVRNRQRKRYSENKEAFSELRKKHAVNYNGLLRKNYKNNKIEWMTRMMARQLFNQDIIKLPEVCKDCGTIEGLQIKHTIYGGTVESIKAEVANGGIYMICKKCEGFRRRIGKYVPETEEVPKDLNISTP